MPLRNRVDPFGNIHIVPYQRGTCMGNRGILHNDQQDLKHYHQHKHWVICSLTFPDKEGKPVRREPMSPNTYTELFFLDEATALAAGHRPCWFCSRPRYNEFVHYWYLGNPGKKGQIDDVLHEERFVPYQTDWRQKKNLHPNWLIDELPYGTVILLPGDPCPYLIFNDLLWAWDYRGYKAEVNRPSGVKVTVLTPPSTMRILAAGYRPQIYPDPYDGLTQHSSEND